MEDSHVIRRLVWYVFVFFFGVFVLTSAGNLGLDSALRYEVAHQLLEGEGPTAGGKGALWIEHDQVVRNYSIHTHGQSVLFLPLELLVVKPAMLIVPESLHDKTAELFVAVLFFPFFGGAGMALLFVLQTHLGVSAVAAWRYTLVCGLATPLFNFGSSPLEVTQELTLWLAGLILALRGLREARRLSLWVGVNVLCLSTHLRPADAPLVFLLTAYLSWLHVREGGPRQLLVHLWLAFVCGGFFSVAAFCGFNEWRFGTPLRSGYSYFEELHQVDLFSGSVWKGLWVPVFSLDFGAVWFCPLLLLVLPARWRAMPKAVFALAVTGWCGFVLLTVMLSRYLAFAGNLSYGPRFQAPLYPLMLLPILPWLGGRVVPRWLLVFVAGCFLLQAGWSALSSQLEGLQLTRREAYFHEMEEFRPPHRWPMRVVNLWMKTKGDLEATLPPEPEDGWGYYERTLLEWDFFWVRAWKFGAAAGFGCGAIAVGAAFVAAWALRRQMKILREAHLPTLTRE